jgi:hypothetical protein
MKILGSLHCGVRGFLASAPLASGGVSLFGASTDVEKRDIVRAAGLRDQATGGAIDPGHGEGEGCPRQPRRLGGQDCAVVRHDRTNNPRRDRHIQGSILEMAKIGRYPDEEFEQTLTAQGPKP